MATEGTIIDCFNRLRVATNAHLNEEDVATTLALWTEHLRNYSEMAVLDATDHLAVSNEEFPTLNRIVTAVQNAERVLREEREFAWGKDHPEADPENIDPVGRKQLIAAMREGLRATAGVEHDHHNGAAGCPICSRHDHSNGSRYCEICNPGTPFVRADGRNDDEMSHCRLGCDPRTFLIEEWADEHGNDMPPGVMGKTTAVRPCPIHAPEQHEALLKGQWGSMSLVGNKRRGKGRSTSVNDDE